MNGHLPPRPGTRRLQRSTRRALHVVAAAGAGTMLVAVGVIAGGSPGAAAPNAATPVLDPTALAAVGPAPAPAPIEAGEPASIAATPVEPAVVVQPVVDVVVDPSTCATTYTVASGDYWLLLARETALPVDELYAVNNASAQTALFPGQLICLPDGATVTTTPPTAPATAAPVTTSASSSRPAAPQPARPAARATSASGTS